MSETTSIPPETPPGAPAGTPLGAPDPSPVAGGDLRDLDDRGVLDAVAAARRNADREEAALLAAVVAYVDLHPVVDPDEAAGYPSGTTPPGTRPERVPLAGPGTPLIAAYAVEALAATLHQPYRSALGLVGDAVELCYRLPRLWALVQDGSLQAWKARHAAHHTTGLSVAAVAFVDRHLAVTAARNQLPSNLNPLIHEALQRCDPEAAAGREQAALDRRDVTLDHRDSTATSTLTATLDTPDALDLDATLTRLAATLAALGDTSPLGVRRAHALGMLANPQRTLTLFGNPCPDRLADHQLRPLHPHADQADHPEGHPDSGTAGHPTRGTDPANPGPGRSSSDLATGGVSAGGVSAGGVGCRYCGSAAGPGPRESGYRESGYRGMRWNAATATLYLHLSLADLHQGIGGTVENLGPATLDLLHDWLQRLDRVTIRPVLDTTRTDTVDRHDPPQWMREVVVLRDGHCVFPGCDTDARACDLDHITPYVSPDNGGPPGQTTPANLACLCRRHHRLKTFTAWTYTRTRHGDYAWTSPHGRNHLVTPTPKH